VSRKSEYDGGLVLLREVLAGDTGEYVQAGCLAGLLAVGSQGQRWVVGGPDDLYWPRAVADHAPVERLLGPALLRTAHDLQEGSRVVIAAHQAQVGVEVLSGHEPYPAVVIDRHWNVVERNSSAAALMSGVSVELARPPVNVLRVSLHPQGLAPRIVNLAEWSTHLLSRLRQQIAATADPYLAGLAREVSQSVPPATSPWPNSYSKPSTLPIPRPPSPSGRLASPARRDARSARASRLVSRKWRGSGRRRSRSAC
jgi:MmyB-like transcription regulator ligand binding domain